MTVLLLVCLAACGGVASTASDAERPKGVAIGYQAPGFELPALDGSGALALDDLRGKVVVMSFWASWCTPCRLEVPALEDAWQRYKSKDVVILGLSVDDTKGEADSFLKMYPVTFPMVLDAGGGVSNHWQVMSLPTTVILDKSGVVRRRHIGYTPQQLRATLAEVDELLKEP